MELSLAVCSDHFIEEHFTDSSDRKLKEDAIPTMFPVVQSSYNKNCILDTQDICEEEEPVFIGNNQSYLTSIPGTLELRLIDPSDESIRIPQNNCLTLPVCLPNGQPTITLGSPTWDVRSGRTERQPCKVL